MPIGWGNTVAFPFLPTPCRASFHQLYAGMPSLSMGALVCIIREAFSSMFIWATSARALSSGVGCFLQEMKMDRQAARIGTKAAP